MNSWKERWLKELDAKIPVLDESVKNAPIEVKTQEKPSFSQWFAAYKKQFVTCVAGSLAAVVAFSVGLPLLNATEKGAVISLEINPRAVFSVNADGKVDAILAGNKEADVILSGGRSEQMIGKTIEQTTQIFVDYAARLGYLNLSSTDKSAAVRVSGCGDAQVLNSVGESLETYFCDKGAYAAVIKEKVSEKELCNRAGIQEQTKMDKLTQQIAQMPTLYVEREADSDEKKDLNTAEITKELLTLNRAKILQNEADIRAIGALSERISECEEVEIFGFLSLDYWTLVNGNIIDVESCSDSLKTLLSEMETLLVDYRKTYGESIDSYAEYVSIFKDYEYLYIGWNKVSAEEYIDDLLQNFDFASMLTSYEKLSQFFYNINVQMPSSKDWLTSLDSYFQNTFVALTNEMKGVYEESRGAISAVDYKDYTEALKREYGSLSAYWEKIKE